MFFDLIFHLKLDGCQGHCLVLQNREKSVIHCVPGSLVNRVMVAQAKMLDFGVQRLLMKGCL